MSQPLDANGEEIFVDDQVRDLATHYSALRLCSVSSIPRPGWVRLSSGVETRANRVEVIL
jgi:hypothetical protein